LRRLDWAGVISFTASPQFGMLATNSQVRRELIFRHYAFEVFGLAFDAISNSSVRLDWQLLNHCINDGLFWGHSPLRPLT
jgi:hypothetical protein